MKQRDSIVDELHKLRERIGKAHGFDADRIAATIRQHERIRKGRGAKVSPRRQAKQTKAS